MKNILLVFFSSFFLFGNAAYADGLLKHIHAVIKPRGGHPPGYRECANSPGNNNATVNLGPLELNLFNYNPALSLDCPLVQLSIYLNDEDGHKTGDPIKTILIDPDVVPYIFPNDSAPPIAPDSSELCVGHYLFTINTINITLNDFCLEPGTTDVPFTYVVEAAGDLVHDPFDPHAPFTWATTCQEIIFPDACYDSADHHEGAELELVDTMIVECCDFETNPPIDTVADKEDISDTVIDPRLSSPNSNLATLNVVPNPFLTTFEISYGAPLESQVQFNIFDTNGRLLYTQKESQGIGHNRFSLDLSDLANGHYYLQVKSDTTIETVRLVKMQ